MLAIVVKFFVLSECVSVCCIVFYVFAAYIGVIKNNNNNNKELLCSGLGFSLRNEVFSSSSSSSSPPTSALPERQRNPRALLGSSQSTNESCCCCSNAGWWCWSSERCIMRLWFARDIWRYRNVFWLIEWLINNVLKTTVFMRQRSAKAACSYIVANAETTRARLWRPAALTHLLDK